MNKKILVWSLVGVLLIAGLVFPRSGGTVVERVVGAVATLNGISDPYTSIGGVKTYYGSISLTATSSQLCTFRNPYATSTIRSFSATFKTGILGANTFALSTTSNSTAYGSSTPAITTGFSVGSNSVGSFAWVPHAATSTTDVAVNTLVGVLANSMGTTALLGPNEYLTFRIATTTSNGALGTYYTGGCKVILTEN